MRINCGRYFFLISGKRWTLVPAWLHKALSYVQIDVHAIEEHGFSSFSETEDERPGRQVLDRMGAQTIAQPWKRTLYQPSLAGLLFTQRTVLKIQESMLFSSLLNRNDLLLKERKADFRFYLGDLATVSASAFLMYHRPNEREEFMA